MTVHLGPEGKEGLARCQELLRERDPRQVIPSAGLVIRLAIRRLLLALVGERADWRAEADPFVNEYLALVMLESALQEIPARLEIESARKLDRAKRGKEKR